MVDVGVGSQKLTLDGGVAGFGVGQLSGDESQGGPRLLHLLLEYPTHVFI